MADANGSVYWYNQRWYDYTGSTLEETQGWGWTKTHHPDHVKRVVGRRLQCLETEEPWEDTFPLRGVDGEFRWFLSRAVPIRADDGSVAGWLGTNTDITEQMEAQDAIRESEHRLRSALETECAARSEAERATKMRDETLAIVAHDLRNPAHALLAAARMLALQATDEKGRRHLAIVERSAAEIERLISDLLDVTRIAAGRLMLQRASLDPSTLIQETVERFQVQASAKDIALKCEVASDVKPIDGDSDRLVRVLSNLLSNALKFSPGGRQISVRAANDQQTVCFSVKDSGIGIPESNLPNVFDRFWQGDRASRTGAGLGLSICKGIVQAHGGHIWVASKVNRGTTFYFTVPMAER
jgi:PAS domain S-box-containing protein